MTPHRAAGPGRGHRTGGTWLRRLDEAVFIDDIPQGTDERRRIGSMLLNRTLGL